MKILQDQVSAESIYVPVMLMITVKQPRRKDSIDIEQLRLATTQRRVLYSHNIGMIFADFMLSLQNGQAHSGIALLSQDYTVSAQVWQY